MMEKTINALLLIKHSSYDAYKHHKLISSSTRNASMPRSEIKRFKQTHDIHYQSLGRVEALLKAMHINFHRYYRGSKIDYKKYNLIITLGGDGTFLEASHQVHRQEIIGVNSDPNWSVGRFCTATANNLQVYLEEYLSGKAHIQLLQRFELSLSTVKERYLVLNDVLVSHCNPAAMSRYYLSINDKKEEQRSSGVWFSTAAGSTGAIHSAGGVVLPAQSRQIQYKPRELYQGFGIKYHLNGGLLNADDRAQMVSLVREGVVFVDGAHVCLPFGLGERLNIKLSNYPLRMIH